MKFKYQIITLLAIVICLGSCEKYLDEKSDKKQVIPATLLDCQAILNNGLLKSSYPRGGEASTDDYTLTLQNWNRLQAWDREAYIWQSDANLVFVDWSGPYTCVLAANQVLETLEKINPSPSEQKQWNNIKGGALLLRAIYFHSLAQIFTKPYDPSTANQDLGIPIRLTPSLSEVSVRGTVQETYNQIIRDLTEAVPLLPAIEPGSIASRTAAMPVKAAAQAALARVYLTMSDYPNAFIYADASLQQYDVLMDYSTLDASLFYPMAEFNPEVLYDLRAPGHVPLNFGRVTRSLYDLFQTGDFRKTVCFREREPGEYSYRGTYAPGTIFGGLATDEMYLIRAECAARAGNTVSAVADLNTLLRKRWDNTFIPLTAATADAALALVLTERRRELPFRGLRWSDLRRLNKETRFATTLTRPLDGQTYSLPPNDLRYTLLIPREVLERVSLPQNPR